MAGISKKGNFNSSFKDYLFIDPINRRILFYSFILIALQFSIFKYFYPQASFIHGDSFSYLTAAYNNLSVNTYLVGYSNFLRLFSVFTKSDFLFTAFQYLLIQSSAFFLLFSLFYFYNPRKLLQVILLAFIIFNPLFLHLGNLVSSDGYFLSLSLIWITSLIWIINKPSKVIILFHGTVLFLAFTTRYNSMMYPIISAFVFIGLSKLSIKEKCIGLAYGYLLCGCFVAFTSYQYKKITGYYQYSPFSGWQLANNAMYAYRYVDSAKRKPVPNKFYKLDKMVTEYFDSTRDTKRFVTESIMASTFYMWTPRMPLMQYRNNVFKKDTTSKELKKWASMGPLYKMYGLYIIKQYPLQFLRYFIWPNAIKYYSPPIEFLESYNSGKDYVPSVAQNWFGYKSKKLKLRFKDKETWALDYYPVLSGVINIALLCSIICFLLLKGWQYDKEWNKILVLGSSIWLLNAVFTILASSAALRFQCFPILITTIMAGLFIDWLIRIMEMMRKENLSEKITVEIAPQ